MLNIEKLSNDGKEQIALALLLLKDFKSEKANSEEKSKISLMIIKLAAFLGLSKEFNKVLNLPQFKIMTVDEYNKAIEYASGKYK